VIPLDRKPGLIAWLRSLGKDPCPVRLDWYKRGQLTLTHRDRDRHSASITVPVEIHGNPPVIAFNATYLADGLEIGSTLCLGDELSPGICRHPAGRFCVIMPMRVTISATGGGSTTRGIHPRAPEGNPWKSNWTTATSWFSNTPEDPDRLADEKQPPKEIWAKRLGELRSRRMKIAVKS
jgi:hypothetical protein